EDGIRDFHVTGVQTCALPICRIAATNALSDVYAMGGTPIMALALVGMPIDRLPLEVIRRILQGGESICAEAGIPVAGGHTIDSRSEERRVGRGCRRGRAAGTS